LQFIVYRNILSNKNPAGHDKMNLKYALTGRPGQKNFFFEFSIVWGEGLYRMQVLLGTVQ
jgi:hypothetical protein